MTMKPFHSSWNLLETDSQTERPGGWLWAGKKAIPPALQCMFSRGLSRLPHPEDALQISGPVRALRRKMQSPKHVEVKVKKQKVSRHIVSKAREEGEEQL